VLLQTFSGGKWNQMATTRVGTDIYAGTVPGFGEFALVRMNPGVHVTVSAQSANPFATNTDEGTNGGTLGQGAAGVDQHVVDRRRRHRHPADRRSDPGPAPDVGPLTGRR
jgi:hypothetical protein